jgi:hypothetical protein
VRLTKDQQERALGATLARIVAARAPRVLFDLDGTLLDNRPRSSAIFRELAREWQERFPEHARRLEASEASQLVFSLRENLNRAGVVEKPELIFAIEFWRAHFFRDEFLHHDVPWPGARDYARACHDAGAALVYFTGRDLPNMALGTLRSLRDHGFPIGVPGVELVLKPEAELDDFTYKRLMLEKVARGGEVVAGFDNEPENCNLFKEHFASADVFLLDSGHVPSAPALAPGIPVLADFTR